MAISKTKTRIMISVDNEILKFIDETIGIINQKSKEKWTRSKFFERAILITFNESEKEFKSKANA